MFLLSLDEIQGEIVEKVLREYARDNPKERDSNIAFHIANKIEMLMKGNDNE